MEYIVYVRKCVWFLVIGLAALPMYYYYAVGRPTCTQCTAVDDNATGTSNARDNLQLSESEHTAYRFITIIVAPLFIECVLSNG